MMLRRAGLSCAAALGAVVAAAAPWPRPVVAQESCSSAAHIGDFIECVRLSDTSRTTRCSADQQPRLLPPVKGTRILEFGQKTQFGTVSKGTVIQAETGAAVQAPVHGMVLITQPWRVHGMLVVIDACTIDVLFTGVHSAAVQAGTLVKTGDTVARMPDTPGAALHFQGPLRRQGDRSCAPAGTIARLPANLRTVP